MRDTTAHYSASKAAVINVMQTSAFQLAGTNVRCNAICPGITETGMTSRVWEGARKRGTEGKIGQINPLKRGAISDEIARVALFLGSDEYVLIVTLSCSWGKEGKLMKMNEQQELICKRSVLARRRRAKW